MRILLVCVLLLGSAAPARSAGPSFDVVRASHRPSDVRVLDRRGEILHEVRVDHSSRRLAWAPLAEISPALVAAVLAAEDRRFRDHRGVDLRALAAAAWSRARGGPARGASTITMQLSALLDPTLRRGTSPRSIRKKWRQIRAAWELEGRWTKDQILEAYLNLVSYRGELQGVTAAAAALFGKSPHGLDDAESLTLAALLPEPNANAESVRWRARAIGRAVGTAFSPGPLADAVKRAVDAEVRSGPRVALAPHAAQRMLRDPATRRSGGASPVDPRTTIDAELQRAATEILRRQLLGIRDQHVRDGAVLVADHATGEVLAYVGSSGDLSRARHVDGIQARRQAGSILKPFLYALALERRQLTTASLLEDTPLEVAVGAGLYRPRNYDEQFRGLVSVRSALAGSLNIPAVRTLALVGPDEFVQTLRRLGFGGVTENAGFYGPSLALGSADVSLWELVEAYHSVVPRSAEVRSARRACRIHLGASAKCTPVAALFSPQTAFLVSAILSDRDARGITFGLESALDTRFWTAVKTGTSVDMRDNWCVGYSSRYTVGVWVGNFSGAPMRDVSGVSGAAPVWHEVMSWLHRREPSQPPVPPDGVARARVHFARDAEQSRMEWFRIGTEPVALHPDLASRPKVLSPADGAVIAIDPAIPSEAQRVAFTAADAGASLRWQLDGADLGPVAAPLLWQPTRGRHVLSLVDAAALAVASVSFDVRSANGAGADAGSRGTND